LAQAVQNKTDKLVNSKGISRGKGLDLDKIKLPNDYKPAEEEEHMSPSQLLYFRNKLLAMRDELIGESEQTILGLKSETRDIGDDAERASRETENILELRNRDRDRKMLAKVGAALRRIEEGTYGICEDTDEPIPVARLDARPQTTLTYDAQERREMLQRQYRSER
jgi:DnaK suppressor protein